MPTPAIRRGISRGSLHGGMQARARVGACWGGRMLGRAHGRAGHSAAVAAASSGPQPSPCRPASPRLFSFFVRQAGAPLDVLHLAGVAAAALRLVRPAAQRPAHAAHPNLLDRHVHQHVLTHVHVHVLHVEVGGRAGGVEAPLLPSSPTRGTPWAGTGGAGGADRRAPRAAPSPHISHPSLFRT